MESKIRIPHVAKGTKAEECIMRAVKAKEVDGKRKVVFGQIFENIGELELEDASSFNYFLYVCINKLFSNETWCNYTPDEKHILKLFNSAYNISTRANTVTVPRLYYNRYLEMVEEWEFNSEEREYQRNIEEIRTIFSMVHAILDREPEKSKQMEDFLGYLESEDEYPSYLKYFQPLNKDLKADEPEVGVEDMLPDTISSFVIKNATQTLVKKIKEAYDSYCRDSEGKPSSAKMGILKKVLENHKLLSDYSTNSLLEELVKLNILPPSCMENDTLRANIDKKYNNLPCEYERFKIRDKKTYDNIDGIFR